MPERRLTSVNQSTRSGQLFARGRRNLIARFRSTFNVDAEQQRKLRVSSAFPKRAEELGTNSMRDIAYLEKEWAGLILPFAEASTIDRASRPPCPLRPAVCVRKEGGALLGDYRRRAGCSAIEHCLLDAASFSSRCLAMTPVAQHHGYRQSASHEMPPLDAFPVQGEI
jgi:hypothetical protein